MPIIYLSLGSNIGDRKKYIKKALVELGKLMKINKKSKIIETKPMHYTKQPKFLNMVIEADTDVEPIGLLHKIKDIEEKIGRKKRFRYGPREIDIDILFYGNERIKKRNLIIPHPKIQKRKFILQLLNQINPKIKLDNKTLNKHIKIKEFLNETSFSL